MAQPVTEQSYLLHFDPRSSNSSSITSLIYERPILAPQPHHISDPENLGIELETQSSESINDQPLLASSSFPNPRDHPLQNHLDPLKTDLFLTGVYRYYLHCGFWGTVLSSVVPLIILHVMTFLILTLFNFTSWTELRQGLDHRMGDPSQGSNLWSSLHFSWSRIGVLMWFLLVSVVIITTLRLVSLIREIPLLWSVRRFYLLELNLPSVDKIQWSDVTQRIQLRYPEFTPEVVVSNIMRRDNYLILFFTQRLNQTNNRQQLVKNYSMLFEWCLNRAVWDYLLDPATLNSLHSDSLTITSNLNARLRWMAILSLICLPFLLFMLLVYYFLAYFERIRSTPTLLGARMFSRVAQYNFRNFNELPIYFNQRLAKASKYLDKYCALEPAVVPFVLLELASFLVGSFIAVVVIVGLWNNDILLNTYLAGYSLLSLISVCVVIYMALRTLTINQRDRSGQIIQKRETYRHAIIHNLKHLHEEDFELVGNFYRYRMVVFLQELWNLIRVPIIFFWTLPDMAHELINFVEENTVYIQQVGYICKYCPLNTQQVGESQLMNQMKVEDEKMNQSFLEFHQTYH